MLSLIVAVEQVRVPVMGAAAATPLFCWLYPAVHRETSVAGTVAHSDFAGMEQPQEAKHG